VRVDSTKKGAVRSTPFIIASNTEMKTKRNIFRLQIRAVPKLSPKPSNGIHEFLANCWREHYTSVYISSFWYTMDTTLFPTLCIQLYPSIPLTVIASD